MCRRFGTLFHKIQKPPNHPEYSIHNTAKGSNQDNNFVTTVGRLWLRLLVVNSSHHSPWVHFAVYITCWTVRQFDPQTCCNFLQTNHTRSWTLQTVTTVTLISMFHCNSLSLSWPVCTQVTATRLWYVQKHIHWHNVLHVVLSPPKKRFKWKQFQTPFYLNYSTSTDRSTEIWPAHQYLYALDLWLYRALHNVLRNYKHLWQENQRTYLKGIVHSHRKTEKVLFDN